MKAIKILVLFIVVVSLISSCSKSQVDILTSTTWHPVKFSISGTDYADYPCIKDNEVQFTSAGKSIMTPKGIACQPVETTDTTKYSLSADAKTFMYDFQINDTTIATLTMTVNELTAKSFKASGTSPVPITIELIAK